jgi:hypothetical protein
MHDISIQNGDWITHPGWRWDPVLVIDQNLATRSVALKLGPKGGIVVYPMSKSSVKVPAP